MTLYELRKMLLPVLPNVQVGFDNDGQVIVFTDKVADIDGELHDKNCPSDAEVGDEIV